MNRMGRGVTLGESCRTRVRDRKGELRRLSLAGGHGWVWQKLEVHRDLSYRRELESQLPD